MELFKKLTKTELLHLLEQKITTEEELRRQMERTKKALEAFHADDSAAMFDGCWDCVAIGRKLTLLD